MQPDITGQSRLTNISTYLGWDHDRLDGILFDVARMVEEHELERADYAFDEFYRGLRRHIRIEEEILFPVFEERTGLTGPTHVMRHEHRLIEEAIDIMRDGLDRANAEEFRRGLEHLQAVLPDHNEKEERILYPATDRALSPAEQVGIVARLARD